MRVVIVVTGNENRLPAGGLGWRDPNSNATPRFSDAGGAVKTGRPTLASNGCESGAGADRVPADSSLSSNPGVWKRPCQAPAFVTEQ